MIGHTQVQHIRAGTTNALEPAHGRGGGRGSAREGNKGTVITHAEIIRKVWTKHGIHMEKRWKECFRPRPVEEIRWRIYAYGWRKKNTDSDAECSTDE